MTTIVTTDYTLPAGQVITDGLEVDGSAWRNVTLAGELDNAGVVLDAYDDGVQRTLTLTDTAVISIDHPATGAVSGIVGGGVTATTLHVVTAGTITLHSGEDAVGVDVGAGGFENHGSITVDAVSNASGVEMANGGSFLNTGAITVTGGTTAWSGATGVTLDQENPEATFVNSGTISAIQPGADPVSASNPGSVGVAIAGFVTLENSGTIEGDFALKLSRDGIMSDGGRMTAVTNSGLLHGQVYLDNDTSEPVTLLNSGTIDGAVTLNDGADTYYGALGSVSGEVHGGDGADSLRGGAGAETLYGDAGADILDGGGGQDYLRGGDGNDLVIGGSGFTNVNGNQGDDTIVGKSAVGDWLLGGQGEDRIDATASTGHNILNGNLGNDVILGGGGGDSLRGGQGDDAITGGVGADWISGDRGADTLTGGGGGDVFHFGHGSGADVVTDFHVLEGDRVQLDPGTTYTVAQVGADTVIDLGAGDTLTLQGVQKSTLPDGWIFGA